jgi:uncharacterized protein
MKRLDNWGLMVLGDAQVAAGLAVLFYTANQSADRKSRDDSHMIHGMTTSILIRVIKIMRQTMEHHLFRRLFAMVLLCVTLIVGVANAAAVAGLYDGVARVKDRSEATRIAAYSVALSSVLTKVSGRSDAATRLGSAVAGAQRYVQRFSYVSGGLLEVGFDSTAVNQLLEQAGLPLWDRDRATTVVVYPVALQGMREAYTATEQTARLRGVPIVWANGVTSEQFVGASPQKIQELAQQYNAVAVLLARADAVATTPASLHWQLVFNGSAQETTGSAEEGPNLAAEVLSRYYAASGKEAEGLQMEVAGIDNLDAYARTTRYLSGMLMVRSVAVLSLQGPVLTVKLELRGNRESLRRALAVDQRLVEAAAVATSIDATVAPTVDASGSLKYRYRP